MLVLSYVVLALAFSPKPIPRVHAPSLHTFMNRYADAGVPVIITGISHVFMNVTTKSIVTHCGNLTVPLRKRVPGSQTWANLETTEHMPLSQWPQYLKTCGDVYGIFDFPLKKCPTLLNAMTIPKYVAQDFLQRVPPSTPLYYRDSWPSLFWGRAGTYGSLHKDVFGSAFWQYVIHGTKKWHILSPHTRLEDWDLFGNATHYVGNVSQGEFIYVPSNCPHQVANADDTLAISGNLVSRDSFKHMSKEIHGSSAEYYVQLRNTLMAPTFDKSFNMHQGHMSWQQFKHQHILPVVHMVFINLNKRKARRAAMEKQVAETTWHGPHVLRRLNAITGNLDRALSTWPQPVPDDAPWANQVRPYWTRPVTRGEVGCTLSHLAALKMLRGKQGITLIVEDDAGWNTVTFSLHLHHFIRQLNAYDPDWDMLLLEVAFLTPPRNATRDLVRVGYFYQTHAYVVSPRGLSKIAINDTTPFAAWDEMLSAMAQAHPQPHMNTLYARDTPLRMYAPREKLVWQTGKTHDTDN